MRLPPLTGNVESGVRHDPSTRAAEVADYQNWRAVFDAALDFRHIGGECACRVFRAAGNPNDLTLLFEWEDLDRARGYMNSAELRNKMKPAGVLGVPEIHYLAEMYSIHRSAAD